MASADIEDSAEIHFAQRLASNHKSIRDRALKRLRRWLELKSRAQKDCFTESDFIKIWKGLHYCLWMQDKPLLQEELTERITQMVHVFGTVECSLMFVKVFLQTEAREWDVLDKWRVDKFMRLVRRMLHQTLLFLKSKEWKTEILTEFTSILSTRVMSPNDDQIPHGLRIHLADIYLSELEIVGAEQLSSEQVLAFLEPFFQYLPKAANSDVMKRVIASVLDAIVKQSLDDAMEAAKKLIEKEEEGEEVDSDADLDMPVRLQYDYSAIADRLFKLGSEATCRNKNRVVIYRWVKKFRDLNEGAVTREEDIAPGISKRLRKKRKKRVKKRRKGKSATEAAKDGEEDDQNSSDDGGKEVTPDKSQGEEPPQKRKRKSSEDGGTEMTPDPSQGKEGKKKKKGKINKESETLASLENVEIKKSTTKKKKKEKFKKGDNSSLVVGQGSPISSNSLKTKDNTDKFDDGVGAVGDNNSTAGVNNSTKKSSEKKKMKNKNSNKLDSSVCDGNRDTGIDSSAKKFSAKKKIKIAGNIDCDANVGETLGSDDLLSQETSVHHQVCDTASVQNLTKITPKPKKRTSSADISMLENSNSGDVTPQTKMTPKAKKRTSSADISILENSNSEDVTLQTKMTPKAKKRMSSADISMLENSNSVDVTPQTKMTPKAKKRTSSADISMLENSNSVDVTPQTKMTPKAKKRISSADISMLENSNSGDVTPQNLTKITPRAKKRTSSADVSMSENSNSCDVTPQNLTKITPKAKKRMSAIDISNSGDITPQSASQLTPKVKKRTSSDISTSDSSNSRDVTQNGSLLEEEVEIWVPSKKYIGKLKSPLTLTKPESPGLQFAKFDVGAPTPPAFLRRAVAKAMSKSNRKATPAKLESTPSMDTPSKRVSFT